MAAEAAGHHSIEPPSSHVERFVFRLYMFFDQFSMVE